MEEEKKPKRPRIGVSASPAQENNDTYQNSDYNEQGGYQNRSYNQGYQNRDGYQPRPYNRYGNQQGGYQQRPYTPQSSADGETKAESTTEGTHTEGGFDQQHSYGYQPRQNGYQPRQNGYNNNRQGGYNNRQGGYNNNRQGGYNNNMGGYQRNQGGFNNRNQGGYNRNQAGYNNNKRPQKFVPRPRQIDYVLDDIDLDAPIRLNKYMANAGICSRREADEYITSGKVKVNGAVVTELGTKIQRTDVVEFDDKIVTPERKCYVLLNKPKDCVTTSDDPNGRLTVMDVVKNACEERIYPVGRLDRNTTGVLLLTNDGELASKLTHPKFVKKKIYHVWTDKPIAEEDMQRIADGIELEDGEIHADAISYVSDTDRNQAGIEIHSGRNRIVRRIFEHLGYRVTKLDRVYFAGLTKKNLPRGRWRYLTQEEVNFLRMGAFE